ncbi:MAG: ATP synthase F1 subunit delta [Planctomycetota bacterium]|jgi:F-type H+-transporting ATPase subunit delta
MMDANIVRVWAQALLEIAEDKKSLESIVKGVRFTRQILGEVPLLQPFLASPNIPLPVKKERLQAALKGHVDPLLVDFTCLLVDRVRGMFLDEILEVFLKMYRDAIGVVVAHVRCAVDLPEGVAEKIRKQLSKMYGKTVELDVKLDPSVLGGMTIQVGDTRFDGTLARALKEVGDRMSTARIETEVVYADSDR